MKKILATFILAVAALVARAEPSTLGYGLTVTGGSFRVLLTSTNTARIGTNDISTVTQLVGDSGLVGTNSGTRFTLDYRPEGITNNGGYNSTNASFIRTMWNNSPTSTNIVSSGAYGALQSGFNFGASVAVSNSIGVIQHGYFRSGLFAAFGATGARMNVDASALNSVATSQNIFRIEGSGDAGEISLSVSEAGTSTGGVQATVNGYAAKIMGRMTSTGEGNISATNAGNGSLLLLNLTDGESALITGAEAIGVGAVTITNDQAIVVGDGRVSNGDGSITAGSFWGDGSHLTNLPSSGGGAALSPWTGTVSAAGYMLTNFGGLVYAATTDAYVFVGQNFGGSRSPGYKIDIIQHPTYWASHNSDTVTNLPNGLNALQFVGASNDFYFSHEIEGVGDVRAAIEADYDNTGSGDAYVSLETKGRTAFGLGFSVASNAFFLGKDLDAGGVLTGQLSRSVHILKIDTNKNIVATGSFSAPTISVSSNLTLVGSVTITGAPSIAQYLYTNATTLRASATNVLAVYPLAANQMYSLGYLRTNATTYTVFVDQQTNFFQSLLNGFTP